MINGSLSIPKLQEFCQLVRQCFKSEAIIAGGCLRDLLHGKEVKDIDVFIQADNWGQTETGTKKLAALLHTETIEKGDEEDYAGATGAFRAASLVEGYRMYPVQLIFREEEPQEVVRENFDFGLCQVWLDGGRLQMTDAYWSDHYAQRFTFLEKPEEKPKMRTRRELGQYCSCDSCRASPGWEGYLDELILDLETMPPRRTSAERVKRLMEKYPGWKFVGVPKSDRPIEAKPVMTKEWASHLTFNPSRIFTQEYLTP